MDFLLSTDKNYVRPTGVLMTSICMNNPNEGIVFHIVENSHIDDEALLERVAEQFGAKCIFYVIDNKTIGELPFGKANMPSHVTIETYNRLFASEFLPSDVHRVLYLDGDMICRKSLKPLFDIDLKGHPLGACHDMNEVEHIQSNRLPYPATFGYFNAGMLMINLDYWRENDVVSLFNDTVRRYGDKVVFHDQDILNFAFHENKKWLPLTYNFQNGYLFPQEIRTYVDDIKEEIESVMYDPAIIHYSTGIKPWNVCCTHPQRWVWRSYMKDSLWRNSGLLIPEVTSFHQFIKNWAFRLGLQENNTVLYRKIILKR